MLRRLFRPGTWHPLESGQARFKLSILIAGKNCENDIKAIEIR
jgi:hypothetical protein